MELKPYFLKTKEYLLENLIPFWAARIVEPRYGGFQTNYDRDGKPTGIGEKNLLCQARCLFALSFCQRQGFPWPGGAAMIAQGLEFLFRHFHDPVHGGYYWIVSEKGKPLDTSKVVYGHAFLIYALAECALASGNPRCRDEAVRVFELVQEKAFDPVHQGYYEHFNRDFTLQIVRPDHLAHKSLDVHMHLMEAFTTLYELTGAEKHRTALENLIEWIFTRMIDPETGTGIAMFTPDWQPIANVQLNTVWGRDRFEPSGKSPRITSYGHNIELAWLFLHALEILGLSKETQVSRVIPIFEHTYRHGVDWENGGIYVEGELQGEATETNKEFWQQAEAMVGFLDAYRLTGKDDYLWAFRNIHDFVFHKMINWEQGEWFALLDRKGMPIWDYMGSSWKVCYHTVRATTLVVRKLEQISRLVQ